MLLSLLPLPLDFIAEDPMPWKPGIDGGSWYWCDKCRTMTPPTEHGTCATCGTVIVKTKKKKDGTSEVIQAA